MCDPATMTAIAATSASIAASVSSAAAAAGGAIAAGASAVGGGISSAAAALGGALGIGGGSAGGAAGGSAALALGSGSITDAALIATAAAPATSGLTLAEGLGIAGLVLGAGSGGASAGVSAKQAKDQGTLVNAAAKAERRNVLSQANQQSEATAQNTFEVAVAALAGRGNVQSANLGDRSVRAISRAVGFQEGTDRATIKRNQEIANQAASARLQGVDITRASQKLQMGSPAVIAGTGAVSALAGGLNMGAGAYQAFSKFRIPTDGPNLAFV